MLGKTRNLGEMAWRSGQHGVWDVSVGCCHNPCNKRRQSDGRCGTGEVCKSSVQRRKGSLSCTAFGVLSLRAEYHSFISGKRINKVVS